MSDTYSTGESDTRTSDSFYQGSVFFAAHLFMVQKNHVHRPLNVSGSNVLKNSKCIVL